MSPVKYVYVFLNTSKVLLKPSIKPKLLTGYDRVQSLVVKNIHVYYGGRILRQNPPVNSS